MRRRYSSFNTRALQRVIWGLSRVGAVWQLAWLITKRPGVQIPHPQLSLVGLPVGGKPGLAYSKIRKRQHLPLLLGNRKVESYRKVAPNGKGAFVVKGLNLPVPVKGTRVTQTKKARMALSPEYFQALKRPENYNQLPAREQWDIDKKLGLLDWEGPTKEEQEHYKARQGK